MEALLYFVIWAVIIVLTMRLGCGAHIMGRGHGHGQTGNEPGKTGNPQLRWMPPAQDVDPVCHKTVATDMAKPSVYSGNVFYFCSRECREVFEAAPDLYVGGGDANHKGSEHSHA